jgi:myosin heavy subunit
MIDVDLIDVVDQPMPEQSDEQKLCLMTSIQESGLIYPIVVQKQDKGRYKVIDGRTRLEIVKNLGHKHIPCIYKDDESEPLRNVLSIELEIFRRQLTNDDMDRLTREYAEKKKNVKSCFHDDINRRLCPGMRKIFEAMNTEDMGRDWRVLFWLIARLPHDEQDAFFKAKVGTVESSAESNEIVEQLRDKVDEMEAKIEELEEYKKAYNKVKDDYTQMAAEALKKKTEELEEQYRQRKLSSKEVSALVEEESKKIAAKYAADLKEMNSKLTGLSKAKNESQKEVDVLKEQLKLNNGREDNYEALVKKQKLELEYSKKVISNLANAETITKQMEIALESIKSVSQSMKMVNTLSFSNEQKKTIKNCASEIMDVLNLIEDIIRDIQLRKTA